MSRKKFKNLFIKLKRTKPSLRYMFYALQIIYIISASLFIYSLLLLEGIETLFRVIIICAMFFYLIIFLIIGLVMLISKKNKILITLLSITLLFSVVNVFGYYYIDKTYKYIDDISKEKIVYTTSLVKLKDTANDNIKIVGFLELENDVEGHILPQEYLVSINSKYKVEYYDNNEVLIKALYDKEIDAMLISSNYVIKYTEIEEFSNLKNDTIIIDSYSKKLDNQDTVISTNKSVTEPFTILLLGVDSEYDGLNNNSAFNGDSIMLVTFNPKTLSATVFSIPRDTYVPIACNNNKSYKINSAAGYGTKCMIDTIENLTSIPIDYYLKINFKGVVALVEALDGITLDVDKPDYNKNAGNDCKKMICEQNSSRQWGEHIVYIEPGENQTLNGEQALAYARNRHQWALSDFKRIEHQQAVVTAIARKTKNIRSINSLYKVLNAISNNIDSNMSTKQMLNFYNVIKNVLINNSFADDEFIHIQKTNLAGYDLTLYINGKSAYTYQYYEESLNEIIKAMKTNLEIEKPDLIKTFNFSVNDEYQIPIIGKTYSAIKRNESLPDFKGYNISYANDWLSTRSISIDKKFIEDNTCVNDTIISQSTHSGTLVSSISSISFEICKNNEGEETPSQTQIDETSEVIETNEDEA